MIGNARSYLNRNFGKFDGSNDFGIIPSTGVMDITGDLSISMWIKFTNLTVQDRAIVSKYSNNDNYSLASNASGQVRFGPNTTSRIITPAINDQLWHYIEFRYNHATKAVNGSCDFVPIAQLIATNAAIPNALNWSIVTNNGQSLWLPVQLSQLRFHNQTLTYEEGINNAYGRTTRGLVGEFLFKEGSGLSVANTMDGANPMQMSGIGSTFWGKEIIKR